MREEQANNTTEEKHELLNAIIVQSPDSLDITIIVDASSRDWRYFRVTGEHTQVLEIHHGGLNTPVRCDFLIRYICVDVRMHETYGYIQITARG